MPHGFAPASIPSPSRTGPLDVAAISQRLKDCFASLKDPRVERSQLDLILSFCPIQEVTQLPRK